MKKKLFWTPAENFLDLPLRSKIFIFHLKMKIEKNKNFEKKFFFGPPAENFFGPLVRSIVLEQKEQLFSPIVDFLATAAT